jgi:pimeloyl-ACP methyl ester carboxylesterase
MKHLCRVAAALLLATTLPAQAHEPGPPPGKLIDVGGRRLHLHCTGSGDPAVILEAGASSFAIDWTLVQTEIASTNRVCSYDRAGMGWSDSASASAPARSVPQDLRVLLQAAGEKPPYILVGASRGGLYVRRYQVDYPDEVVGMVLVDPAHEDRLFTMFEGQGVAIADLTAAQLESTIRPGDFRIPRRQPQKGEPFDRLPPDLYATRIILDTRLIAAQPTVVTYEMRLQGAERERADLAKLREVGRAQPRPFGDRPIVVLSRGLDASQEMKDVHAAAARISSNSRHTVVPGSGHEIHLFVPVTVIQAIRDVNEAVRTKSRLAPR